MKLDASPDDYRVIVDSIFRPIQGYFALNFKKNGKNAKFSKAMENPVIEDNLPFK